MDTMVTDLDIPVVKFMAPEPEYQMGSPIEVVFAVDPMLVKDTDEIAMYELGTDGRFGVKSMPTQVRKRVAQYSQRVDDTNLRVIVFQAYDLPDSVANGGPYEWVYRHVEPYYAHKVYQLYGNSESFRFY